MDNNTWDGKTEAQRIQESAGPDMNITFCSHFDVPYQEVQRTFFLGRNTNLFLCPLCSGLIVETILKEFMAKK